MTIKNALKQLAPTKIQEEQVAEEVEIEEEEEVPLDRQEIVDLIAIRQYVVNATGNSSIDRSVVNYMNGTLLLLDKKIINLLQSDQFKKYIGYQDVRKAIEEAAHANNIKSGLRRNPHTGQLEKIPQ